MTNEVNIEELKNPEVSDEESASEDEEQKLAKKRDALYKELVLQNPEMDIELPNPDDPTYQMKKLELMENEVNFGMNRVREDTLSGHDL